MHITVYFENKLEIMSKRKQKTVCAIWYNLIYKKRNKKNKCKCYQIAQKQENILNCQV